jgi:hypothetical protein
MRPVRADGVQQRAHERSGGGGAQHAHHPDRCTHCTALLRRRTHESPVRQVQHGQADNEAGRGDRLNPMRLALAALLGVALALSGHFQVVLQAFSGP